MDCFYIRKIRKCKTRNKLIIKPIMDVYQNVLIFKYKNLGEKP